MVDVQVRVKTRLDAREMLAIKTIQLPFMPMQGDCVRLNGLRGVSFCVQRRMAYEGGPATLDLEGSHSPEDLRKTGWTFHAPQSLID